MENKARKLRTTTVEHQHHFRYTMSVSCPVQRDHAKNAQKYLVGGLEHFLNFPMTIGFRLSSQLTNSIIFQRGEPTTNQICVRHVLSQVPQDVPQDWYQQIAILCCVVPPGCGFEH